MWLPVGLLPCGASDPGLTDDAGLLDGALSNIALHSNDAASNGLSRLAPVDLDSFPNFHSDCS